MENIDNLKIRFYLKTPVILNRFSTIDSILLKTYYNELAGRNKLDKFIQPTSDNIDFIYSENGVFSGSIWYVDSPVTLDNSMIIKSIERDKYIKWTAGTRNIAAASGPYKRYCLNLDTITVDSIYFYIRGDKNIIEHLCSRIHAVGKKQSIGYGIVSDIRIDTIPEDKGFILSKGNPSKPVPASLFKNAVTDRIAFYRTTPPYYLPTDKQCCYMPSTALIETRNVGNANNNILPIDTNYISPSEFACKIAGIEPLSIPVNPHVCGACGKISNHTIDVKTALKKNKGFNDYPSIRGKYLCRWCYTTMKIVNMLKLSNCLIDESVQKVQGKGGFSADQRNDLIRNISNIKPPYLIALKSIGNTQHVVWKAAVGISSAMIPVQYGNETLYVDTELLKQAIDDMDNGIIKKAHIVNTRYNITLSEKERLPFLKYDKAIMRMLVYVKEKKQ